MPKEKEECSQEQDQTPLEIAIEDRIEDRDEHKEDHQQDQRGARNQNENDKGYPCARATIECQEVCLVLAQGR